MAKVNKKEKVKFTQSISAAKKKLKSADMQLKNEKEIETEEQNKTSSFPIFGIRASAGGLEVLEFIESENERKRTEEALQKSELKYPRLHETITDTLWWNDNFQLLFCHQPEEIELKESIRKVIRETLL